jgi:beta-glucanase (GH16 family)
MIPDEKHEWTLVWKEEFDGEILDSSRWEYEVNAWGGGNEELQFYTARSRNCRIRNGLLIIEAHEEDYTDIDQRDGKEKTRQYTSARIRTKNKGDWKYGRFEIRAKLPGGKGLWPAIWMLPTDNTYGTWAASGEIDIMEFIGHQENIVHGTLHYGGEWPENKHSGKAYQLQNGSFTEDFHVFCLEWVRGEIKWYIDGNLYQTQTKWYTKNAPFPAPFDQRFHMILNLAVGGTWPGNPDKNTAFPATMLVDYVRVYRPSPPSP